MMPIIQITMVLTTSARERASALMCFVTVTPKMLKLAIEKIPRMQNVSSHPLWNAYEKYCPGR
jgi:hypothetical protein